MKPESERALFLRNLPAHERISVERAIALLGRYPYPVSTLKPALEIHRQTKVPLKFVLETALGFGEGHLENSRLVTFLKNLQEEYELENNHGKVKVIPSLMTQTPSTTPQALKHEGLHRFTHFAFRVLPTEDIVEAVSPQLDRVTKRNPNNYGIIVEGGLATVNKNPVAVITNAQATAGYYTLSRPIKLRFKEAYPAILEIIKKAAGDIPLLIPSNATVKDYIAKYLLHKVPDSVLNEFYDRFSEKRKRRKSVVRIKNIANGYTRDSEMWLEH